MSKMHIMKRHAVFSEWHDIYIELNSAIEADEYYALELNKCLGRTDIRTGTVTTWREHNGFKYTNRNRSGVRHRAVTKAKGYWTALTESQNGSGNGTSLALTEYIRIPSISKEHNIIDLVVNGIEVSGAPEDLRKLLMIDA